MEQRLKRRGTKQAPVVSEAVSRRQFAKRVQRDERVIRRLCDRGELPLVNGKIPLHEGLRAFALVRDHAAENDAPTGPAGAPAAPRTAAGAADLSIKQWRARREQLRYEREAGDLLSRTEVDADAARVSGAIRAGLLALSSRMSLELAGLLGGPAPAAVQAVIDREVNALLEALQARLAPAEECAS